jgi:hypothetical protein
VVGQEGELVDMQETKFLLDPGRLGSIGLVFERHNVLGVEVMFRIRLSMRVPVWSRRLRLDPSRTYNVEIVQVQGVVTNVDAQVDLRVFCDLTGVRTGRRPENVGLGGVRRGWRFRFDRPDGLYLPRLHLLSVGKASEDLPRLFRAVFSLDSARKAAVSNIRIGLPTYKMRDKASRSISC